MKSASLKPSGTPTGFEPNSNNQNSPIDFYAVGADDGGGASNPLASPANLTATAVSSSQINLTWMPPTKTPGITGFRVERCQGSTCGGPNFTLIVTSVRRCCHTTIRQI
jgi:hypothetical protein